MACALAREGAAVAVLEASVEFEDRVRGESMVPVGRRRGPRPRHHAPGRARRGRRHGDARRLADGIDTTDPGVFPLFCGLFAAPETIPDELVDAAILDRIRRVA